MNNTLQLLTQLTSRDLVEAIDSPKFLEIKNEHPETWKEIKTIYHSELERMRNIYMDAYCGIVNEASNLEDQIDQLEKEKDQLKESLYKLEKENAELKLKLTHCEENRIGWKSRVLIILFSGLTLLMVVGFVLASIDKEVFHVVVTGIGNLLTHAKHLILK